MLKNLSAKKVFCIGIGGIGVSGLAELLLQHGIEVVGSDLSKNAQTTRLQSLGITVFDHHDANNIKGAELVVYSSAIKADNPERCAAIANHIPLITRGQLLAEVMKAYCGISVAGTHGKTTASGIIAWVFSFAKQDPTFMIGGVLRDRDSTMQLGKSKFFIAESDESDASFLFLSPTVGVMTNIDLDHMETYDNNLDKLCNTFVEFLHHLPFYGLAVLCLDDANVHRLLPSIQRPIVTYGLNDQAHYYATNWSQIGMLSQFTVHRPNNLQNLEIKLKCPGRHNVLNALASIAIATELGVADQAILDGLEKFAGVGRRFQILGQRSFQKGVATIVDDYGHHPQEVLSTINALRQVWPDKRLIHVFQPHRFSRTKLLFSQFVDVLILANELLLLDIYAAGEMAIAGINSASLLYEIQLKQPAACLTDANNLIDMLNQRVNDDCIILMQGAGNIGQLAQNLMVNNDKAITLR